MDQLSLLDAPDETKADGELNINGKKKLFAACSHYRECSDERKCVSYKYTDKSGREYIDSENCVYRTNIESGKIFIGKSADGFDRAKYAEIVDTYLSLDEKTRFELNCILVYYEKFRRSVLWYNSPELCSLARKGFITASRPQKMLLKYCKSEYLRNAFLTEEEQNALRKDAIKERNNPRAKLKKDDAVNYLLSHNRPELEAFIERFSYIGFERGMRRYLFELYNDYLRRSDNLYQKELPLDDSKIFKKDTKD